MATAAPTEKSGKVVIRNIGLLLSGDIDRPILDADTLVIKDGLIVAVGKEADCDTAQAQTVIDARRTCVAPGLIDSHVHPVFGDWTPRQNQTGWIDSTMNGGVTTMISAGEVHLPPWRSRRSGPLTISAPAASRFWPALPSSKKAWLSRTSRIWPMLA